MKRRAIALALALLLPATPGLAVAQSAPSSASVVLPKVDMLTEGQDFNIIAPARRTSAQPGQAEVIVFFKFTSKLAAQAVSYIQAWQGSQEDALDVTWQPIVTAAADGYGARVFFALRLIHEDSLVPDLIGAYASGQVKYGNTASLAKWLDARGVDELAFAKALDDGRTRAMAAWAPTVTGEYGITGTLALVMDGKYRVQASDQDPPPLAVAQAKYIVEHTSRPTAP